MHFGENQLSRSLIGLSPLPTTHPLHFQLKWVRASTKSYLCFTLAMGRSLRFGSRPSDYRTPYSDSLSLRLPHHGLTSPLSTNSQAHSSKGTPSPTTHKGAQALTDCKRPVSGTISLPSRGTFHLSLTVLVRYRSPGSIQAYRVVPADSQQIPRARCYLGNVEVRHHVFSYRTLTVYGRPSQATSPNMNAFSLTGPPADDPTTPPQPHTHNPCRVSHAHGLASSTFARRYSQNHYCFLFLRVLRCFTSPRSPRTGYTFTGR